MTETPVPLVLHEDRLLPPDPAVRAVARRLYAEVAAAPIVSPHGHVDPAVLVADEPFTDPAALLVTPDHYVTRLLHANGVGLDALGVARLDGTGARAQPREVWRALCTHWSDFRGTPSRYWLETELVQLFGVEVRPSARTADAVYDRIAEQLTMASMRPRALFARFGLEVLATTDDPASDLSAHAELARADLGGRVLPTFRADRYTDPGTPGWAAAVAELADVDGVNTGTHAGLLAALRQRRQAFAAAGATATDAGPVDAGTEPLEPAEAERLHAQALRGPLEAAPAAAYRRDMLYRQGLESAEDGLVMQLHAGVFRNHHRPTSDTFGPDSGHDIPLPTDYVRGLRPLLDAVGTSPTFRMVLFTVDETVFSREIAPLAGFYPSVFVGAPWWFLDTPDAITRFRSAVTDTVGFSRTSGFVDDTRAYCSIPARHDMSRRVDAGHLARLVVEHRLDEDEAADTIRDLAGPLPRRVFRLG